MVHRLRHGRGALAAAGTLVACGVLGAVGAAGAAEQVAGEVRIGMTASEFVPDVEQIATGDTVVWDYAGGVFHNVKADTGPAGDPDWAAYATVPKNAGEDRRTFGVPGTYTYYCEVHPGTMTGTLEVAGAPVETPTPTPTATATPSATPTPSGGPTVPDDHTMTPAPAGGTADSTAPTLSGIGLTGRRGSVRVRFRLSEPATVTLWLKARASGKVLRTVRLQARAGDRTVIVRSARVTRGRYTVELQARDPLGNRTGTKRSNLRVRGR